MYVRMIHTCRARSMKQEVTSFPFTAGDGYELDHFMLSLIIIILIL